MEPDALAALGAMLDDIAAGDFSQYSDCGSQPRLSGLSAKMDYVRAKTMASFDDWGDWGSSGARNASSYVAAECRIPRAEAARWLRRGRLLDHLALFGQAWAKGLITKEHIDRIGRARNPRTEAALERDEAMLVKEAIELSFPDWDRLIDYWSQHADPDGVEEDALERRARRDVFLAPSVGGTYLGSMNLDEVSGAIVSGELDRLEHELFAADWARAEAQLGRSPKLAELARTPAQRRADALVEMAIRSQSAPADARRPAPLFTVLVGYETAHGRICELAGGSRLVLTPGSLLPWLDQAYLERAVFTPQNRVEVSETARFFTGATRRALEIRDKECADPYCHEPVERCQADHIIEWSQGGPTVQENGRMLCGFNNRQRNQRPPPDG
jgi:hypothetical protein